MFYTVYSSKGLSQQQHGDELNVAYEPLLFTEVQLLNVAVWCKMITQYRIMTERELDHWRGFNSICKCNNLLSENTAGTAWKHENCPEQGSASHHVTYLITGS